jgi:NADPH-dependent 2,4-dienoyl-CoA reductase/sulfur reductase-like enzyme
LKSAELSTNKKKRIVVIGGVAAGTSAASKARRIDPEADVKIIQEESVVSYGACGIPYVIEGIINNFEELKGLQMFSKANMT